MKARKGNGWDAKTYDNISTIQEECALKLIQLRNWTGKEIVMDAGCGSGRVRKILAKEIPNGKIYAIDIDVNNIDVNMIDKAKDNLSQFENVTIINSDLLDLNLQIISSKVDIIFSNAALHWILNHQKLFNTFFELLNQNGQLLIQCGGYGNLKKSISIFESKRL